MSCSGLPDRRADTQSRPGRGGGRTGEGLPGDLASHARPIAGGCGTTATPRWKLYLGRSSQLPTGKICVIIWCWYTYVLSAWEHPMCARVIATIVVSCFRFLLTSSAALLGGCAFI